jgi:uncharacterized membrane protein
VTVRRAMFALALGGLAIAAYLTWVHYADAQAFCTGISDCERVQNSDYAEVAGVPVALIGLLGYAAILASLALPGDAGLVSGAFLALAGLGFSGYLTWVELERIDAICQWCVASAAIMTALAALATVRLLRA